MNKLFESQKAQTYEIVLKAKDDEIVNLNSQINTIADTLNSESDRLLKAKEEDYENQIKELNKSLEIREIEIKNFQNRIQDLVNKISEFDQNTSNNNDYPDYKEYKQFKDQSSIMILIK